MNQGRIASKIKILGICFALLWVFPPESLAVDWDTLPPPPKTTWDKMWEIQLINKENTISQEITGIEYAYFDGEKVDARTAQAYQDMYDHALADGITLYLRSGYRSISTQNYLYQQSIQRYLDRGYSYSNAVTYTQKYYAVPGGSEHNIALAFDIITPEYHNTVYNLTDAFAKTEAYYWLYAYCPQYGFILRYPEGRTADTGINFEPWHYRYVGVAHAEYMAEHNLILEEYVALYKAVYPELYGDTPPEEELEEEYLPEDVVPEEEYLPEEDFEEEYMPEGGIPGVPGAPAVPETEETPEILLLPETPEIPEEVDPYAIAVARIKEEIMDYTKRILWSNLFWGRG